MSDPLIRRADDIAYEAVDAADGLEKGVLIGEESGGGNLAIRRFTLAPGGSVPNTPRHRTRAIRPCWPLHRRHRGRGDAVGAGDSLHIPAGAVHWYRNDGDEPGAFLCAVPAGDDDIKLQE